MTVKPPVWSLLYQVRKSFILFLGNPCRSLVKIIHRSQVLYRYIGTKKNGRIITLCLYKTIGYIEDKNVNEIFFSVRRGKTLWNKGRLRKGGTSVIVSDFRYKYTTLENTLHTLSPSSISYLISYMSLNPLEKYQYTDERLFIMVLHSTSCS